MSELLYDSTQGGETGRTASQAMLKGLARDGGLFVSDRILALDSTLSALKSTSCQGVAYRVMRLLLANYTGEELRACAQGAYDEKFDTPGIMSLTFADDTCYLELFHGKTVAFKDMALSILPYLMTTAAKKNGVTNKIKILTVTSDDIGKVAMAGFADVPSTSIVVFYPKGDVSRFQKLQMLTQKDDNTAVVSIEGSFDDAQITVKQIFGDYAFETKFAAKRVQLSSVNSTSIGHLVPQIVYYVRAYLELLKEEKIAGSGSINVRVPISNFGDILTTYFAKRMGLPIDKLIYASNDNKVLFDFFETGVYDKNREFILITSLSASILVSSNLEHPLYLSAGYDATKTRELMEALKASGRYAVTEEMRKAIRGFVDGYAIQEEVAVRIRSFYEKIGYVIDTHTAVASKVYEDHRKKNSNETPTVTASTANPFRFFRVVMEAIADGVSKLDDSTVLELLRGKAGVPFPPTVKEIRHAEIRHNWSCKPAGMESMVWPVLFE